MDTLSKTWLTEKHIDFEYKRYLLLAYLQSVNENFTEQRLYPHLSDLIGHYRDLIELREGKKNLYENFPGSIKSADLESFNIVYEKIIQDDELMKEIESIIEFSIPQMEQHLRIGKKIYDLIEEHLNFFPVGIVPLQSDAGYLFLCDGTKGDTKVFEYQMSIFESASERYRAIHTKFISSFEKSISNTYESIKTELLQLHRALPNPATYAIETDMFLPLEETFLPLAKRTLVKHISVVN
ncbi:MAG: hypothetical protein JJE25_13325 [Bacteroidia bacterium]|nr:hypothetical protein [Bacteroidia bacterium]